MCEGAGGLIPEEDSDELAGTLPQFSAGGA